jgi:hypothetical protein
MKEIGARLLCTPFVGALDRARNLRHSRLRIRPDCDYRLRCRRFVAMRLTRVVAFEC